MRAFVLKVLVVLLGVIPSFTTQALEFEYISSGPPSMLAIGLIERGDSNKLLALARQNPLRFFSLETLYIDSNGGDVEEAIKLANLVRESFLGVNVPRTCASACFYVFAAARLRGVGPEGAVGVHRAYFDPSHFSSLPAEKARVKLAALAHKVQQFLTEHDVPAAILERIQATLSVDIHWLSRAELAALNKTAAYYDELVVARCGWIYKRPNRSEPENFQELWRCSRELNELERMRFLDKYVGDRNKAWASKSKALKSM